LLTVSGSASKWTSTKIQNFWNQTQKQINVIIERGVYLSRYAF